MIARIITPLFVRALKSVTKDNHGTSAENIIFLYDSAFTDEKLLFRVLVHELAHQLFLGATPFENTAIGTALGWRKEGGTWARTVKAIQLLDDSDTSLDEAYANAIELFYTDAALLKAKSSHIYNWIRIEYGDKID